MNLNFSISELVYSDTAVKKNINNMPDLNSLDNLLNLIVFLLQPVRDRFGSIKVTSGYRCDRVNALVNGSPTSNHRFGYAADIIPQKATFKQVYDFITQNLSYDECFIEKNSQGVRWLHVAYRKGMNRKKHNPNFLA